MCVTIYTISVYNWWKRARKYYKIYLNMFYKGGRKNEHNSKRNEYSGSL